MNDVRRYPQRPAQRARTSSRSSTASRTYCRSSDSLPCPSDVGLTDRTATIRASVHDVQFSLMLTIALVVMVIFLFLRSRPPPSSQRRGPAVAGGDVRAMYCSVTASTT